MNRIFLAAAPFIVACAQDSSFTSLKDPEPSGFDTSSPPVEIEEYVAPEVPETCPDRIWSGSVATVDESCLTEPPTWRYTPVVEWKMDAFSDEYPAAVEALSTPATGHFTDDDGDGILGSAGDIPDLVVSFGDSAGLDPCGNTVTGGVLRAISGDGSTVHWTRGTVPFGDETLRILPFGYPAIGDIDNDGKPEIIHGLYSGRGDRYRARPVALSASTGEVEWVGEVIASTHTVGYNTDSYGVIPGIWDIDQDGKPEVTFGSRVYNGEDGTEDMVDADFDRWDLLVTDLDGDGQHELVSPVAIYEQDGTKRCQLQYPNGEFKFAAVGDLTGDGQGNIVTTGSHDVNVYDDQCHRLWRKHLQDSGQGGGATIADYDGDGTPEIGVASAGFYYVFDSDGSELWAAPVSDYSSNATSSSVYDFEGDGYAEVVYAGEQNLWVLSGVDGTPRMVDTSHSSCTAFEYPVTVDIDNDGQVEIVVADTYGVRVVGDADNGWVPGRHVWNQHHFSILNINDDLSIPTYSQPNWPEYNTFRSADLRANDGLGTLQVDALPYVVDICEVECGEGTVQVVFQGANHGLADATDGVNLALYAEDASGNRTLLEVVPGETLLRAGFTTEGYPVTIDMTDIPTGTLILVADDDGTGMGVIEECDEDNNEVRLEGLCADE